jgi:hypothetical protein
MNCNFKLFTLQRFSSSTDGRAVVGDGLGLGRVVVGIGVVVRDYSKFLKNHNEKAVV